MDRREELLPASESLGDLREVRVIHQVGSLDHEQKVLKLLGAVGGDDEVPVQCWLDGRNLDGPSGPRDLWPPCKRCEHRRVGDHGDCHAVEQRHIDQLANAAADSLAMCSDGPERGIGTRRPLTETTTGRKRWQVREATLPDGPAGSLQSELGARMVRPRTRTAEWRDHDNDQRGIFGPEGSSVDSLLTQQDVCRGSELERVAPNGSLRRVEIFEECARAPAPEWVACRPFHLDHVSARIGQ